MVMKTCFKCGQEKPLSEFYKHSQMADGHLNKCKECTKADKRRHDELYPEAVLDTRIAVNSKNPSHENAYRVVEAALNAGVLTKPEYCQGCGKSGSESRLGAHHQDYSKPLGVVWVCAKCHRQLDARRREEEGLRPFGRERRVVMLVSGKPACYFDSVTEAAKAVRKKQNTLSQCLSGKSKTCAGFEWAYEETA